MYSSHSDGDQRRYKRCQTVKPFFESRRQLARSPVWPPAAPIMEEAVAEALSIKAEGNARFASGDFDGAVASYSRALGLLPEDPHDRDAASARATLLSNRAAAKLKLGEDLEGVVRDCTTVLGLEDSNKKARFRRAEVRQPATRDGRRVEHHSGLTPLSLSLSLSVCVCLSRLTVSRPFRG